MLLFYATAAIHTNAIMLGIAVGEVGESIWCGMVWIRTQSTPCHYATNLLRCGQFYMDVFVIASSLMGTCCITSRQFFHLLLCLKRMLFVNRMTDWCLKHQYLKQSGTEFVKLVRLLLMRLLDYRSIIREENRDNRMSCTVNLLVRSLLTATPEPHITSKVVFKRQPKIIYQRWMVHTYCRLLVTVFVAV